MEDKERKQDNSGEAGQSGISRRQFLKRSGLLVAASSLGTVTGSCTTAPPPNSTAPRGSVPGLYPASRFPRQAEIPYVPMPPGVPYRPDQLRVLTPQEVRILDALTARMLPGSPEDPGAREAGVVTYIDNLLSFNEGFVEATYRSGPFAEVYEGDAPPEGGSPFEVIYVPSDEIERYGFQSMLTPRDVYRLGLGYVNNYARAQFGGSYADLTEEQQDSIIEDMLEGDATGFDQFSSTSFFHVLRRHTAEGMFGDPVYGGNRGLVGWTLVGYPGAQRAYTPSEIYDESYSRPPLSWAQLADFSPGHYAGDRAVLPVSGAQGYSEFGPFGPTDNR
jgi:gluconate 2-dehydrogenase gamma chain